MPQGAEKWKGTHSLISFDFLYLMQKINKWRVYYGMGHRDLKCSCRMITVKFKGTATFLEGENAFIGYQWLPLGGREESCMRYSSLLSKGDPGGNTVLSWWPFRLVWTVTVMSLWWAWLPMKKDHLSSASKSLVNRKDFSWLLLLWLVMTMWVGPWDEKDSPNQWNKRPDWPAMSTRGRRGSGSVTANIYHLGLKSTTHLQILALSMGFRTLKIHPNFLGTVTNLWDLDVIIFENVAGIGMWSTDPLPPILSSFIFHPTGHRDHKRTLFCFSQCSQIHHNSKCFNQPKEGLTLEKSGTLFCTLCLA